jgi:mono/diheme cytochrome c family protein
MRLRRLPFRWRLLTLALGFALHLGQTARPAHAADKAVRTVWDGVYSAAQADRGQSDYGWYCGKCHGEDLTASGNVLRGGKFMDHWREDNLKSLFSTLRDTMPRGAPRSLDDDEYLDIVAYLLQVNAFPAGSDPLTADALERIRIVGKEGPKPVPDFALVTVVGCLVQLSGDTWMLRDASEPVRTRNPWESTKAELADAAARPPGPHSFRLLDIGTFRSHAHPGHWMEAKGFLIRAPGDNRINPTWLQTIHESCRPPQ